ncbi:hypothetical protein [Psychromonas antarctica]|uniref:hypothetical protein n=1 Tax=Psychromonas antarctica TaxID=67573 RepID=UPI001EE874FD|nr:hypothetical protein [Psychromonas antarctica]MCG6199973.1 hypothetical protein [Psychromonas antarctica]
MENPKIEACVYILTALLQRLEREKTGLIEDIIKGVEADQNALPDNIANTDKIDAIFCEALKILNLAGGSSAK